ncbi:MAG: glycogen synthase, partial [Planctomycetes bacterium]|nr:glycogen synthase [Planctomycetota bacterium]
MTTARICFVSSEIAPFAKTGGLADVATGLSRYLASVGHDVRLFMPLYRRVRQSVGELKRAYQGIRLTFGGRELSVDVWTTPLPGQGAALETPAQVFFLDCPELFDRPDIYSDQGDEHLRFAALTRGAIESCQRMQWAPHVFHCNDWHTGLLPLYLRTTYGWDRLFSSSKTLLTIHNIGYQGTFATSVLQELGLMEQRRHLAQDDLDHGHVNFLKTGIMHADALTTVSRTYAREIQTAEFGMGLEELLRRRSGVLHGIVNGVDYGDWDPAADPLILHPYTADDLSGKAANTRELLEAFELPYDSTAPVIGIVSRLTGQKGFELLPDILPVLLHKHDVRLVVLGSGESDMEKYFQWLRDTYPQKVANYRGYNNELAHRIEAGADMFLMPSRYEPCGLNQMYSLR